MTKLTNEAVAKALGYRCTNKTGGIWFAPNDPMSKRPLRELPDFIHSLDAITAEIEAREMNYTVSFSTLASDSFATVWDPSDGKGVKRATRSREKTAPLALCAALLAYLKDRP